MGEARKDILEKKKYLGDSIETWRILVVRACDGFRRKNTTIGACVSENFISVGIEHWCPKIMGELV